MYTLQECIMKSKLFRRGNHICQVLADNGIKNWDDFVSNPIPNKQITINEIKLLDDLRRKEIYIRERRVKARENFTRRLKNYASPQEAARIAKVLTENGIYTSARLHAISDELLSNFPGIGKKSLNILRKVKADMDEHISQMSCGKPCQAVLEEFI